MDIGRFLEKRKHLVSLDFFRGLAIMLMILVNNSTENSYRFLKHAEWNGLTVADIVFPLFLWIVGASLVFSFAKRLSEGQSKLQILGHVFRRSLIIFAFGLILNLFLSFSLASVRVYGVLQMIAVTYLFASLIYLYTKPRWYLIIAISIIILTGLMLKLVPVPGVGSGVIEPEKNIAHHIDANIMKGHMWDKTVTWDPEGIFVIFSGIATVLFGVLAGHLLKKRKDKREKAMIMSLWGTILIFIGGLISIWLPINKYLWTSSFSVLVSGIAMILFSLSYYIIDVKGYRKWTFPFVISGLNAISLYLFSGVIIGLSYAITFDGQNLQKFLLVSLSFLPGEAFTAFVYSVLQFCLVYLIGYVMYKKGIFIKV